jgi:hypothetical protein
VACIDIHKGEYIPSSILTDDFVTLPFKKEHSGPLPEN